MRRTSRACASASRDALVKAFGGGGAFGFAFMRRVALSSAGVFELDREMLDSRGVAADLPPQYHPDRRRMKVCFWRRPFLSFSLGGRHSEEVLTCCATISLCEWRLGAVLDLPVSHFACGGSCASRITGCQSPQRLVMRLALLLLSTSARRLRKSERWTRPTVCDFSISSADTVWPVKDRGVEVPLFSSSAMVYARQTAEFGS